MSKFIQMLCMTLFLAACMPQENRPEYVLVIHGGAGTAMKSDFSADREKQYTDKLNEVLTAGAAVLENGGSSLEAVETAIRLMEDSPLFNAGRGSVFNEYGQNEMDASIMDGRTMDAGAVAGVHTIKNPITAARLVMDSSRHVMLIGKGAEAFAKKQGLEIMDTSYFFTRERWDSYQRARKREEEKNKNFSTVGAVALDKDGNLAAGTSTGGMTYKMQGRVGDAPVIGAGTYANNKTCAVSATGHGEFFIRNVVAYDISARMEYAGMSLKEASEALINVKLKDMGANGGVIAVDSKGNIATPFNTESMIRGWISSSGERQIIIYEE